VCFAGQLAVAIENAQLFTEVQNAKIYNETLLQNLTTGVVAADRNGMITVFNREVEQLTGMPASEILARRISNLPDALHDVLSETIRNGERQENREIVLRSWRQKHDFAREQFALSRPGRNHTGRVDGADRHHHAQTSRDADSAK
jgi:PAS domain S-box-containing protein